MNDVVNGIKGSKFWINSASLNWQQIQDASNMMLHWRFYDAIKDRCKNFGIIPINKYVLDLYPKPQLMSIVDDVVTFRQKTHAEIWVQPEKDGLYALDKCWQRQFYPSPNTINNEDCFDATYRFYIPWIPLSTSAISFRAINDEETPFIINNITLDLHPPKHDTYFYNTSFIDFTIKKTGDHMKEERYGIIDIGTPMYDMSVKMNEEQIDKIYKQYQQ